MRVLTSLDRGELEELRAADEFFWLALTAPDASAVRTVGEVLELHPLAQEDTIHMGQRPKLDRYDEHMLMVAYGAERAPGRDGDAGAPVEAETVECHLYIADRFIVSVHAREPGPVRALRESVSKRPSDGAGGEIVYELLDALTDTFFPVLQGLEEEIDRLDEQALRDPRQELADQIVQIRRRVAGLRRVVRPQWEVVVRERKMLQQLPGSREGAEEYFADLVDHLNMAADDLEVQRERVSGVLDIYYTGLSHRFNRVGERLSLIGTLLLPVTLITGFFGMNFNWMIDHLGSAGDFLAFGVGGMLAASLLAYAILRRQVGR